MNKGSQSAMLSERVKRHNKNNPPLILLTVLAAALGTASAQAADETSATQQLAPVTVTATMSEHDVRTAPASVTVISREELEVRNPNNLLDAVRGEPGITLSPRQVGGRKTISMRGMEGRHVLTLIDGRRITATDDVVGHSDYQYGWLPMSAVERVEIIRGPMSTLYGSEALGGVVNLITRKPTDHWEGSVSLKGMTPLDGRGDDSSGGASFYAAGPLGERLSLRAYGLLDSQAAVANPDDERYSEIEGSKSRTGGLGATLKLTSEQSLDFNYSQGHEDRDYDDVYKPKAGPEVPHAVHYDLDRQQVDAAWRGDFDGWRGQLRAYQSEIDIQNAKTNGRPSTRPQFLRDRIVDGHASTTLGRHTLTAGGEWREEFLKNSGLIGGKDQAVHEASFLQDEWALTQSLTFTGGLRYDHHELFGNELSPRAYLVWEATPDLVIKGGYGHAFKAPTLKQISPSYIGAEGPHTFLGNADIQPETLDSYELSADWRLGDVGLRATVFRSEVHDLITYRLIKKVGPSSTYMYDNVDKARITGLETGFTWDINRAFAWSTDVTLLRTEDLTTGSELQYRPKMSLSSHVDWSGPDGWSVRVGAEHIGSQLGAEKRLPSYTLWNASVGKTLSKHTSVRLGAENIGNVRLADLSDEFGYAERGVRATVNLRTEF